MLRLRDGSRILSGSEFQVDGPATTKHRHRRPYAGQSIPRNDHLPLTGGRQMLTTDDVRCLCTTFHHVCRCRFKLVGTFADRSPTLPVVVTCDQLFHVINWLAVPRISLSTITRVFAAAAGPTVCNSSHDYSCHPNRLSGQSSFDVTWKRTCLVFTLYSQRSRGVFNVFALYKSLVFYLLKCETRTSR